MTCMKSKNYSNNPLQVRLHKLQEETLNEILNDREYRVSKNIISKSDKVRSALFSFTQRI